MKLVIETPRLLIRPLDEDDVAPYIILSHDVGYNCFSTPGCFATTQDGALAQIRETVKRFEATGTGKFLVLEKKTGEPVGRCGMAPYSLEDREIFELGYRLRLKFWEQGFATEAARAVLADGFERLGLPVVYAFAVKQNRPSLRVIEKLNFTFIKEFMHADLPHRLYDLPSARFSSSGP